MPHISPIDPPKQLLLDLDVPRKNSVSVPEAATILACTTRQVQFLIADGTLQAIDIPRKSPTDPTSERRHYRILTNSIKRFLENRRTV